MNIELTAKQHSYIIGFLPDKSRMDVLKYVIEVSGKLDLTKADLQLIRVNVSEQLILDIYATMGIQQERLTFQMNADLRSKLLEQVGGNLNVMQGLGAIAATNANELSKVIEAGYNFLSEIKG